MDEEHIREIDYLSGDDDYKANWMSNRRERWGMLIFNTRSFYGVLQGIKHIGGRGLKRVVSSFRPNSRIFVKNLKEKF